MMTSFGRLKVVRQLDDSLTQSYLMLDPKRGEEILLHILPEENEENRNSLARLEKALIDNPEFVLERGDLLGVRYVISAKSGDFQSLTQQLGGFAPERAPAPKISDSESLPVTQEMRYKGVLEVVAIGRNEPSVPPTTPTAGEFTKLFTAPPACDNPMQEACGIGKTPSLTELFREVPATPETSRSQPGEFTSLFQPPPTPTPQMPRVAGPEPARNSARENGAAIPISPGPMSFTKEFPNAVPAAVDSDRTMLFEALSARPLSPAKPAEPDVFAKFFENPLGPNAPDIDFDKHEPPLTAPAPRRAGEFTGMFGAPFTRDQVPRNVDNRHAPANATEVFSKPSPGPPPMHPPPQEPGDYTRMFDPRNYVPRVEPSQAPAETPEPPARTVSASTAVMVGVLAALVILAVALILYFALRR